MADTPSREDLAQARREELARIKQGLTDRAEDLAPELLPDGHRVQNTWREGSRGSKSIVLSGPNKGVYCDFEQGGKAMNMLDAVAVLLTNSNLKAAVDWSRGWLGYGTMSAAEQELATRRAEQRAKDSETAAQKKMEKNRRIARGIWHNAHPLPGTPAAAYLAARGIDIDELPRPPGILRYASDVYCAETKGPMPAMLAGLWKFGERHMTAVHRTYLARNSDGWAKARLTDPRSTLGPWPGGIIPLARGETRKPWSQIEEGELVALGEGIEEGLSIALVQPEWRVAAVGYVGNFANFNPPVWCHVVLCLNNDADDSPAARAIFGDPRYPDRASAIDVLENRGHVVRCARPPKAFKDWNDFLTGTEQTHA